MRRARTRAKAAAALFWCLSLCFFFSLCACLDIRTSNIGTNSQGVAQDWGSAPRRGLGRPGSYPPRCIGKCGRCSPCHAVHVTVPPGSTPVTTEYYPETWRCKCGNRLYIP